MSGKKKVDIDEVKKEIKPYLHKELFQKPYIEASDVTPVCRFIRGKFDNVEIHPRPGDDGKPYLKIKVHRFLGGGELTYEIKVKGKSIHTHKPKNSVDWIDRMEEWDALMH